ncbi:MAG: universal stress protein, partial [Dehalococcoidia bacterium]
MPTMRIDEVTFNRVVVPLDGTMEGEDILPLARTIALATGARVELVHVVDPDDIVVMLPGVPTAGYPRRVVTKPRREPLHSQVSEMVKRRYELYFQQIGETFRGIRGGMAHHVLEGRTPHEILKFAGAGQDTLLAISIRSGMASNLLTAARCPLLVSQSQTRVPHD